MRCVEFTQRWNEALDLRESPEDDVDLLAHLDSCPACRAAHAGFELVCDVLRSQAPPDLLAAELSDSSFSLAGDLAERTCRDDRFGRGDLAERVLADLTASSPWEGRRLSVLRFRGLAVRTGAAGIAAATLFALYLAGSRHAATPQPTPVAINSLGPEQGAPDVNSVAGSAANPALSAATASDIHPAATGDDSATALASASPSDLDEQPDLGAQPNFTAQPDFAAQPGFTVQPDFTAQRDRGGHALVHGIDAVAYGIDAVGAVARDTSQELATAVRRIPDVAIELAGDGRTDLHAASETFFNVSHSLRPVAASMTETWQIFKRALPAGEPRRG